MPKIKYVDRKFSSASKSMIETANGIIAEYEGQGFQLTLRQLYYQFVSRGLIPNNMKSYKNLGSVINDGRLAGLIDWNHITDRTRELRRNSHWSHPSEIIETAARSYAIDIWKNQRYRPEVWIEKDALIGVIEGVCRELDVPYFSCRGYTSQSEMWAGAMRLGRHSEGGQTPVIFHLGDHDPSGKDMTRDITDRLQLFMGGSALNRLALNMDQIEEFKPPPNPAKLTDSRAEAYIAEFGDDSWELDALEPKVIVELIRSNVEELIDVRKWNSDSALMKRQKAQITKVAKKWDRVIKGL